MGEQAESFAIEVERLFEERVKAFAQWCETNWTFDGADNDIELTPEQVEAWNRCCESIKGAASVWLEEFDP